MGLDSMNWFRYVWRSAAPKLLWRKCHWPHRLVALWIGCVNIPSRAIKCSRLCVCPSEQTVFNTRSKASFLFLFIERTHQSQIWRISLAYICYTFELHILSSYLSISFHGCLMAVASERSVTENENGEGGLLPHHQLSCM